MSTRGETAGSTENRTAAGNGEKAMAGRMSAPPRPVPPEPPAKERRPNPASNVMSRSGSTVMLATGRRARSASHSADRVPPAAAAQLGRGAGDYQDGDSPTMNSRRRNSGLSFALTRNRMRSSRTSASRKCASRSKTSYRTPSSASSTRSYWGTSASSPKRSSSRAIERRKIPPSRRAGWTDEIQAFEVRPTGVCDSR